MKQQPPPPEEDEQSESDSSTSPSPSDSPMPARPSPSNPPVPTHTSPPPTSPSGTPSGSPSPSPGPAEQAKEVQTRAPQTTKSFTKEPGWRRGSTSRSNVIHDKPKSDPTDDAELEIGHAMSIKSETSISSNGPLKEFYRSSGERIKHQPKIHFSLNDDVAKQALAQSDKLAIMHVSEPSLISLDSEIDNSHKTKNEKSKVTPNKDAPCKAASSKTSANKGAPICPLDSTGGYRINSLTHIKMVKVDSIDEDDDELSIGAAACEKPKSKSISDKSKSGRNKGAHVAPKTAPYVPKEVSKSGPKPKKPETKPASDDSNDDQNDSE